MIVLDGIVTRSGTFALHDINLTIPTGRYGVLMGRTGCGKTTVLEAICGLKRVHDGSIRLMDRDVTGLKTAERGIGYVPQDRALFMSMTVYEHLAFALRIRKRPRAVIKARVEELADLLGLGPLLNRKPPGLSGGEAQRVALGRALSASPGILCLDEPLSALDADVRSEMCALLETVKARTGVTTLHVTHDRDEAKRMADCLFRMVDGSIEEIHIDRL